MAINYTILFLVSNSGETRPISYSGGSTVMTFSDNIKNSIYYYFSPSHKYSLRIETIDNEVSEKVCI